MWPTIISIGQFHLSAFGVSLALAFIVGAFNVWREARNRGLVDDKIFDNLVVVTIAGLIGARLVFGLTHWSLFAPNWLRIFLPWKYAGLSMWGALIFSSLTLILYTLKQKLPLMVMFAAYSQGLIPVMFFVSLGTFLDGSAVGKETNWVTGLPAVGLTGKHHPVGLYGMGLTLLLWLGIELGRKLSAKVNWSRGVWSWVTVSGLGVVQLLLAFVRADLLYLGGISLDYILATILLVGPWGPIYVLIGGATTVKQTGANLISKFKKPT